MDTDLKELERRTHRANFTRRSLEGAGAGALAGGLSAAALRAAGIKVDPEVLAMGATGAGGFLGMAKARAENLKDTLRETRTDDRHLRRLALREAVKQKHSAFADELALLLAAQVRG